MTSQIILGNFDGVVVASDSASYLRDTKAVSHGNRKIVDLGDNHRVVVAIAASAWQDGQPISATLRQWKKSLVEPLLNIEDYAESFNAFHLAGSVDFSERQSHQNIVDSLEDHYNFLLSRLDESGVLYGGDFNWLEGIAEFVTEVGVTEILQKGFDWLESLPNYPAISDAKALEIFDQYDIDLEDLIFPRFAIYDLTPAQRKILLDSAPLVVSRAQYMPKGSTDLHFVGYGANDNYPGVVEVSNRGTIGNLPMQLVLPVARLHPNDDGFSVLITPVAQDSAITSFITGSEFNSVDLVMNQISLALRDSRASVNEVFEQHEIRKTVERNVDHHLQKNYIHPFQRLIGDAHLDRMSEIARTLIEIQKIRSESNNAPTTVAGDVDVVRISDAGVHWVRGRAAD